MHTEGSAGTTKWNAAMFNVINAFPEVTRHSVYEREPYFRLAPLFVLFRSDLHVDTVVNTSQKHGKGYVVVRNNGIFKFCLSPHKLARCTSRESFAASRFHYFTNSISSSQSSKDTGMIVAPVLMLVILLVALCRGLTKDAMEQLDAQKAVRGRTLQR